MSRHMMPAVAGLAVFPLLGMAVAAYLLFSAGPQLVMVSVALMLLSVGLFASAIYFAFRLSQQDEWLWSQQDAVAELSEKAEAAAARIAGIEQQQRQPAMKLDEIMSDVRSLRDGFRGLVKGQEPSPPLRAAEPAPAATAPRPVAPPRQGAEHLELLLEPVVELATGSTAHYRALLDLTDDGGHVVRHDELMQKADRGGMRPALDAHLVKLVAPVLRRLRTRNPGVRAFVPLGLSTLESREEGQRIAASLERDVDVAGGIIFEIDQRDLGALGDAGIQTLARLARLGATLALAGAQVQGLDLAALRQLGVRFLSFPPHAAEQGNGTQWRDFVQHARAMQFQIVISGILGPQQASLAGKSARFGYGPFFAPPRKVRPDAGAAAGSRSAHAA